MKKFKYFAEFLLTIMKNPKDSRLIPIKKENEYLTEEELQKMEKFADEIDRRPNGEQKSYR